MINIKKHLGDALISLRPGSAWKSEDNTYDTLVWLDSNTEKPTYQEIQAEIARLQAEHDALEYQRLRAEEYPSIEEQLDMQYWDSVNGTTVWADTIAAIKSKYPKIAE